MSGFAIDSFIHDFLLYMFVLVTTTAGLLLAGLHWL